MLQIVGGNVTLKGLTISGGAGVDEGAGILAQNASLSLVNSKVVSNVANQAGGGIFALGGTLNLQSSSIMNNRASNDTLAFGGGIVAWGTATTITSSTISENSVFAVDTAATSGHSVFGTGGGIYADGGTLNITGTTVSGNLLYAVTTASDATSSGAGISSAQTPVTVGNSTFQYNALNTVSFGLPSLLGSTFSTNGGSLTVTNSKIEKNTPARWKNFSYPGATVTLRDVDIDGLKIAGTQTLS